MFSYAAPDADSGMVLLTLDEMTLHHKTMEAQRKACCCQPLCFEKRTTTASMVSGLLEFAARPMLVGMDALQPTIDS